MRSIALLLMIALFSVASAEPEPKTPRHNPEWTDHNASDPGVASVADDLQKIVVLCARDHNSPEFKRAWAAYVSKHKLKGSALESTRRKVVNEAFQHRQSFGQAKGDRKDMIEWKKGAENSMRAAGIRTHGNKREK